MQLCVCFAFYPVRFATSWDMHTHWKDPKKSNKDGARRPRSGKKEKQNDISAVCLRSWLDAKCVNACNGYFATRFINSMPNSTNNNTLQTHTHTCSRFACNPVCLFVCLFDCIVFVLFSGLADLNTQTHQAVRIFQLQSQTAHFDVHFKWSASHWWNGANATLICTLPKYGYKFSSQIHSTRYFNTQTAQISISFRLFSIDLHSQVHLSIANRVSFACAYDLEFLLFFILISSENASTRQERKQMISHTHTQRPKKSYTKSNCS